MIVTPARDESVSLRRLAASLIAQTSRPAAWIVVENGSTDDTAEVVRTLAAEHDWVRLLSIEPASRPVRGYASARAFNRGVASLDVHADLIMNADADVSFEAEYFAKLGAEFEARPRLGIASGLCYELEDDVWKAVHVTPPKIRGGAFTFRGDCLAELSPIEERHGWDGIDIMRAQLRGWETEMVPGISYFHHRATGERDASRLRAWVEEGALCHYMWYRPSYLAMRATYRLAAERDFAAAGLVWGYARHMRHDPRQPEPGFARLVRTDQGLRRTAERIGRRLQLPSQRA